MTYMIIETHNIEDMRRRVQEALDEGYKLYGSLVIYREYPNAATLTYCREMVKDKEPYRRGMF